MLENRSDGTVHFLRFNFVLPMSIDANITDRNTMELRTSLARRACSEQFSGLSWDGVCTEVRYGALPAFGVAVDL